MEQNLKFMKNQQGSALIETFMGLFKTRTAIEFSPIQGYDFSNIETDPSYKDSIGLLKEKIYSFSQMKFFDSLVLSPKMITGLLNYIVLLYNK